MLITLIKYKVGTQAVSLLKNPSNNKYHVIHEDREGLSQFPTLKDNFYPESILYDFPERVNKGIKKYIVLCFVAKNAVEFINRCYGWHSYDKKDKRLIKVLFELQEAGQILINESTSQFMAVR